MGYYNQLFMVPMMVLLMVTSLVPIERQSNELATAKMCTIVCLWVPHNTMRLMVIDGEVDESGIAQYWFVVSSQHDKVDSVERQELQDTCALAKHILHYGTNNSVHYIKILHVTVGLASW
eukprot:TRINITY_DN68043_c0_g1_i1.p1 TRINITY_DN68043_c0_g1~~TRINITY_DN68043_c0_g1_i1.p1  ORF type:complete len:120 (+),score=14.67 TRINITY_DN68043_c0_g1_i1:185-544(+)